MVAAAHDGSRPVGRRVGLGAPHRRVAPDPHANSRTSSPTGRTSERAPALPERLRRQPRRAEHASAAGTCSSAPTSSTTRRSSTAAAWRGPTSRSTRTGTSTHLDALLARRRAGRSSSATRSSRWTATSRRSTTSSRCAARHGALLVLDEAHAVLGPHPSVRATSNGIRVGTLSKTLGSLGGFVAGRRRFIELLANRRPARSSSRRRRARPTRPPPWPRCDVSALRRGRAGLIARLRAPRRPRRPGHPSPIVPVVIGGRGRAPSHASRTSPEEGLPRPGDPAAVGPAGNLASARHAVGGAHRRAGRRPRRRARTRSSRCSIGA